jgi:galactonate dehydratase
MKIASITTYPVPPRWLFLRMETDDGTVGWGEPVVEGRAATVAAAVDELADYLVGRDPRAIEDIWTVLYRGGFYRGGPIHMSALAGIDQALWDIKGKHHGARSSICSVGPFGTASRSTPGSVAIARARPRRRRAPPSPAGSAPSR